ncbi:hypothetical protein BDP27DRAFT_1516788 [Rhodocollybia butyracea]|uniref:Uncharacterized protein n=1 Tax=Rhodocollybia butyracea TaxID=206335 RepID=A0A9P5TWY6_9AGAR|nr:hypothetical protein BDP27DRAFT_1516788 [Rhodocollybia butyracea]
MGPRLTQSSCSEIKAWSQSHWGTEVVANTNSANERSGHKVAANCMAEVFANTNSAQLVEGDISVVLQSVAGSSSQNQGGLSQKQGQKRPAKRPADSPGEDEPDPKSQKTKHPEPEPQPQPQRKVVTFIDRKGVDKGGVFPAKEQKSVVSKVFNEGLDTPKIQSFSKDAVYEGPSPKQREWIYYKFTGIPYCPMDNPCFGWIARGDSYGFTPKGSPTPSNSRLYMGMTAGPMVQNGFGLSKSKLGKPLLKPLHPPKNRPAEGLIPSMQDEWERLVKEFDLRFMSPNFRPDGGPPPNVENPGGSRS